jgi:hypothetical protein
MVAVKGSLTAGVNSKRTCAACSVSRIRPGAGCPQKSRARRGRPSIMRRGAPVDASIRAVSGGAAVAAGADATQAQSATRQQSSRFLIVRTSLFGDRQYERDAGRADSS